ncbi:DUF1178 family protein [Oceaniglobus trochenteri]|uniref:DUF1178 family protein n=1 Tax=Oceaniglobus trochenteri TaxID=2763260 RepID=UPI001CFFEC24|nr:DUF1178 family protein [Oceaniglobus trochenteri]
MIRFSLACANRHDFDSWFASGAAFDTLRARKMISCPTCGDTEISKSLMAPRVNSGATRTDPPAPSPSLAALPDDPAAAAMAKLRRMIETNADDVGSSFVSEARAIHDGLKPARSIYGQARPDEARKLVEDGIPVAPLPFIPTRKTN